jgi:hypothetical protein
MALKGDLLPPEINPGDSCSNSTFDRNKAASASIVENLVLE